MKLSDGEIIEHFLLPARRFVEAGAVGVTALRVAPGFSRKSATPDVDAEPGGTCAHNGQVRGSGQAKAAAVEFLDKPITNIETGFVAVVTRKSLGKMMSASAWEKSVSPQAHYHAVGNIDALFRLAIQEDPPRAGTRPEDKGIIKSMRHFDVPMPYEGDVLRVQITVKEFEKPDASKHRIYTLHALKIETPAFLGTAVPRASSGLVSQNRLPTGNAGVEARFTQMVEIVKESLNTPDVSFSRSAAPSPGGLTPWRVE